MKNIYNWTPLKRMFNVLSLLLMLTLVVPFHALPLLVGGVSVAYAADEDVRINEVAWMGTDESASDEWIELHNDGTTAVDLTGWVLGAQDGTPVITVGTDICTNVEIPAGGFFYFERTDDTSLPDVVADCIYSGALDNDGEILVLSAPGPHIIQGVDALTNGWPAGDNETKETMQWCEGEWITADATPNGGCNEGPKPAPELPELPLPEEGPVCGNSLVEEGEMCDDGNGSNGDGCNNICELEVLQCGDLYGEVRGWYGEYFNYSSQHPDMELPGSEWPDDGHGDPLSDESAWDTDWYDEEYFRFSRIDSNIRFGDDFFPLDPTKEELINGHEYHFGVHWRALVETENPGEYLFEAETDDDVWVYVDGELVGSNPGIHPAQFTAGTTTLTGANVVDIFFAERNTRHSVFDFRFINARDLVITPLPEKCQPDVEICKYEDLTGDGATEDDTLYGSGWGFGLNPGENKLQKTDEESCVVYEDLLPSEYEVFEENRDGWTATAVRILKDNQVVKTLDSFFDIFVELELGDDARIEFYNYNVAYCGDGVVNQEWEQCDGGEQCSDQCLLREQQMCNDLVLAKLDTDRVINEGEGSVTPDVYLGSSVNKIPNGTWFALYHNGSFITDSDVSGYEDVEGLAVERQEGSLRVVLHGSHPTKDDIEHVDGTLIFSNATVTGLQSDGANPLENGFDGNKELFTHRDEVATSSPSSVAYWMTVDIADDGFITEWDIVEDCSGICGYKFEDKNEDKKRNQEEPGVSRWEITLSKIEEICEERYDDNQKAYQDCYNELVEVETTYTTLDGAYCFLDVEPGEYVVSEGSREGWYPSTATSSTVVVESENEKISVDFGNIQNGSIHGLKFFDHDKDGVRDEEDEGLEGWEIRLYKGNGPWEPPLVDLTDPYSLIDPQPYATTTTDENGNYWFTDLLPGIYQVFEVNQDGWVQTAPGLATDITNTTEGGNVRPVELIPGAPRDLYDVPGEGDPEWMWYMAKLAENPTMKEIIAARALCSVALKCQSEDIIEALEDLRYFSVKVSSGAEIDGLEFGNWTEPGSIHGLKFNDLNGNGELDEQEPGLPDWEIQLYRGSTPPNFYDWISAPFGGNPFATTTTCGGDIVCPEGMGTGSYWFDGLPPGVYQVYEVQQDGWVQTAPGFTSDAVSPKNAANVLPQSLIPGSPHNLNNVPNIFESEYDWYQTKLVQNASMLKLVGAHGLCALATLGGFPCGEEQIEFLENLRYYTVLVGAGESVEGGYFGNQVAPELEISEEGNRNIQKTQATVSWTTNIPATSRVVYGTSSVPVLGSAPNYGYPFSTVEDPTKVTSHVMTLTGLTPGATYYWRAVSSASPEKVGQEQNFETDQEEENNGGGGGGSTSVTTTGGGGGGGGVVLLNGGQGGTETGVQTQSGGGFVPTTPITPVTSPVTQAPSSGSGSGGGAVSSQDTFEDTGTTTEDAMTEDEEVNGQVAAVGFLGVTYECGIWHTLLALLVLLATALYFHHRHGKTKEGIIAFVVGAIIVWLLGAYNCAWLLAFLALVVVLLIGWDMQHKRASENTPSSQKNTQL